VSVANEDLLAFDGTAFTVLFDGSDVGLSALAIDAVAQLGSNQLLLSFTAAGTVPGLGTVDDSDVVRFTGTLGAVTSGTFAMYVDGSDVGLTTDAEDVDAVETLADGRVLLSTTGTLSIAGLSAADEDLVGFRPTSLGPTTAGSFGLYFDGSDVGLVDLIGEDVDAAAVAPGGALHLSTVGAFTVPGAAGADEDVVVFVPTTLGTTTTGAYDSTLAFDGSAFGLAANDVVAVDLP
jgi:hypothetical protein